MKITEIKKSLGVGIMTFLISGLPNVAWAEAIVQARNEMIPTQLFLEHADRDTVENEIREFIESSQVRTQLLQQGVAVDEVSARLASLSQLELMQMSKDIKEVRAGGEILTAVLLVVLILFLVNRI